jgi:hypothetical protein
MARKFSTFENLVIYFVVVVLIGAAMCFADPAAAPDEAWRVCVDSLWADF